MKREGKPRLIEQGAGPRGPIDDSPDGHERRRQKSEEFLASFGIAEQAGIGNGLGHGVDALSQGNDK